MTPLAETILKQYQTRKTARQKDAFLALLREHFGEENVRVEQSGLFRSRNIVIGDPAAAEFIAAAHYDTPPVLPFPNFIAPKNILVYILYVLLLTLGFALISIPVGFLVGVLFAWLHVPGQWFSLVFYALLLGLCALMMFGPANRHTANDNTSGVLTVLEAAQDETIRARTAFVLFDHEEIGMIGSAAFAKAHKKELGGKLLLNFDCVGDGDTILMILSRAADKSHGEKLRAAFLPSDKKSVQFAGASGTLYPSDQMSFKRSVGVAAFRRSPLIGLYLSRIHTKRDTVCEEENIACLLEGMKRLAGEDTEN